jgi:hypothetical protein
MVRTSSYLAPLALMASAAMGKEVEPNLEIAAELYESGQIHDSIMANKLVRHPRCTALERLSGH